MCQQGVITGAEDGTMEITVGGFVGVKVIDDYTVDIVTQEPYAAFMTRVVLWHMTDEEYFDEVGADGFADTPIGTGPFKFVKWVRGDRVEMARNEKYWNPTLPYLDKVIFKFIGDASAQIAALKAGDIDVIGYIAAPEQASEMAKDKRFKVFAGTTTGEVIMSTNNKKKPFDDKRVRLEWVSASEGERFALLVDEMTARNCAVTNGSNTTVVRPDSGLVAPSRRVARSLASRAARSRSNSSGDVPTD